LKLIYHHQQQVTKAGHNQPTHGGIAD